MLVQAHKASMDMHYRSLQRFVTMCLRLLVVALLLSLLSFGERNAHAVEPDVRLETAELLDDWLKAQNQGSFADYERLYDRAFTGVRRSGAREARLDRRAWMEERRRMFEKKIVVKIEQPHVMTGTNSARVIFTQIWESGTYRDVGRKELVLLRRDGDLKILREELFSSALGHAEYEELEHFMFVVGDTVVLDPEPNDEWAVGEPEIRKEKRTDDRRIRVVRHVDTKKLPEQLSRWMGRKLRLMDATGVKCGATISGFRLAGRLTPWGSEIEPADEVWSMSSHLLVAQLTPNKSCRGAIWALPASRPVPTMLPARRADARLEKAALEAFRALPEYKELQAQYLEWR